MNSKEEIKKESKEKESMIAFLKETKEGKYAKIEETSLPYSRINQETIILTEEYYYGVR